MLERWQTIASHGLQVGQLASSIAAQVAPQQSRLLHLAGRWHDLGKAHPAFQCSIQADDRPPREDIAKAPDIAWPCSVRNMYRISSTDQRHGFRHELASTLGLVCAHHGKVRIAWHSSPADQQSDDARLRIRGVFEGDVLPSLHLADAGGGFLQLPATALDLSPSAAGLSPRTGRSWTERVLALLDRFGPFTLAWLETVLRAADQRASNQPVADHLLEKDHADQHVAGSRRTLAQPVGGGTQTPSHRRDTGPRRPLDGDGERAGGRGLDSPTTRPPHTATRYIDTALGILSYRELAPHLAERVAFCLDRTKPFRRTTAFPKHKTAPHRAAAGSKCRCSRRSMPATSRRGDPCSSKQPWPICRCQTARRRRRCSSASGRRRRNPTLPTCSSACRRIRTGCVVTAGASRQAVGASSTGASAAPSRSVRRGPDPFVDPRHGSKPCCCL